MASSGYSETQSDILYAYMLYDVAYLRHAQRQLNRRLSLEFRLRHHREVIPAAAAAAASRISAAITVALSESLHEYRRFSCSQSIASTVERSTYVRTRIGKRVKQVSDAVVALGQRDTGSGKVLFLRSDATTQSTQSLRL